MLAQVLFCVSSPVNCGWLSIALQCLPRSRRKSIRLISCVCSALGAGVLSIRHHALSNCNRNVEMLPDLCSLISIPLIIPIPHLPLRLKKAPLKPEDAEVLQRGTHTFTLSHMHRFTLSHTHIQLANTHTLTLSHMPVLSFCLANHYHSHKELQRGYGSRGQIGKILFQC